jgi:aminoglycoside 6'-N-acetyltransferase
LEEIAFRRVTRDDFPLIGRWLAEPHVTRWWNHEFTPEAVERDFGPSVDGAEPSEDHLVLLDGFPIGLVQYSRYEDYPEYLAELAPHLDVPAHAVSIDYLIGDPRQIGRGVGSRLIAAFADHIWETNEEATCIIVPVSSANEASWRALLRAGFRLVGRGDLKPDNPAGRPLNVVIRSMPVGNHP